MKSKYWPEMDLKKIPPHRRNIPPKKCPECGSIRVDLNSGGDVVGCLKCSFRKEEPITFRSPQPIHDVDIDFDIKNNQKGN